MTFLFPDTPEASDPKQLGGKGAALQSTLRAGFAVPPWFALPPGAKWSEKELSEALARLGDGLYAVRSSGATEDGAQHSFAGQFDSHLEVKATEVAKRIEDVRKSAKSEAILSYCQEHKLPAPGAPTVLVQRMIDPRCAGVAFSADPVSGRRSRVVISAVEGSGEKLVSGECDGETWHVDRDGGAAPEAGKSHILESVDAEAIAALARDCEAFFKQPQDIEWAIDHKGKLWLLQSRPITTLGKLPDPDDILRVWDNSNIAESYGGVTTPLTFSFASRVYDAVYREFCVLMSVPKQRIQRADEVFPNMLGLIRGRVYYNLANWYRVLALLPGFQVNRAFMEQMMGVKEPLPAEIVDAIVKENRSSRFKDGLALAGTVWGLIRQHFGLLKQIRQFYERLNQALDEPEVPLEQMTGEELVAHYRSLERQLMRKWDAPLVNDFFAMIFYGVLRSLCRKWAKDEHGTLQNQLLMESGDIISAEPPRRIMEMARLITGHDELIALLLDHDASTERKLEAVARHKELRRKFDAYLEDFGDRCLEELKLESPTVRDDAASLLHSIGAMAMRGPQDPAEPRRKTPLPKFANPLRALVFRWVLKHAKARVQVRENLRFERTRLFGRVRTVLREVGKRLQADGRLEHADDVFYLELTEVLALWEATSTQWQLAPLVEQRRREFDEYRNTPAPPDRFNTRGPAYRTTRYETTKTGNSEVGDGDDDGIKGTGACPGVVRGKVRVVLDPRSARLEPGEILVAQQTDPGWVVLFPAASGLLVERGSLLSHSAIVSRELNLPCIVSLPSITTRLKTGDLVEMDGSSGVVTRIQE
ncbi:MAG: PEP/pyruvate-binding domain-containing protein [Akkermansiaceae bacterium]|nr:PEP/pyruvate-binding domain-containing protein [Akkermansiaceae bacterium]